MGSLYRDGMTGGGDTVMGSVGRADGTVTGWLEETVASQGTAFEGCGMTEKCAGKVRLDGCPLEEGTTHDATVPHKPPSHTSRPGTSLKVPRGCNSTRSVVPSIMSAHRCCLVVVVVVVRYKLRKQYKHYVDNDSVGAQVVGI